MTNSTQELVTVANRERFKWVPQAVITLAALILVTFSIGRIASADSNDGISRLREINSGFPSAQIASDDEEVLRNYTDYLRFVVQVGRTQDRATSERLARTFETLRLRHPQAAARFLRGLRFEMVQKLELMGASPQSVSSTSPEIRAWVGRFQKEWLRECDEHLFRSVALNAARRNQAK